MMNKTKKIHFKYLLQLLKNLKTFYHFSRLYLNFPDFFQVWKIAGQISRLFQEFKTLYMYELCLVVQWYHCNKTESMQQNDFTFTRFLGSINGHKKEWGARERQAQSPVTCSHYAPCTISHITSKHPLYRLLTSCLLISVCDRFLLISLLETLSLHD